MCNPPVNTVKSTDVADELAQGYVTEYGTAIPWSPLDQVINGSGGVVTTASDIEK